MDGWKKIYEYQLQRDGRLNSSVELRGRDVFPSGSESTAQTVFKMVPIKNCIKVQEIGDNNIKKELFFEDTIENPAWYTVEDNQKSVVIDKENSVVKFETDDNNVFYSTIEITKAGENDVLSSLQRQETFDDSLETSDLVNSNDEDINHTKTFCCDICGICFAVDTLFKDHMEEHKKQTQVKLKCSFCKKKFKLNFSLNKHIQKYHMHSSSLNEHMKTNKNNCSEKKADVILNLKLSKLNGVWKSKTNYVYKCNICFEKFQNENNLIEHESIHKQHSDNDLKQCEFCFKFISVSEFNDHIQQSHNTDVFKSRKCKLRFEEKQHLKRHFIQRTKSSHNIFDKFRGKHKNNVKAQHVCTVCGIDFNNLLLFKRHMVFGCNHYSCRRCRKTFNSKYLMANHMRRKCINLNENINKTSVNIAHFQDMVDKDNSNLNLKENSVKEINSSADIDLMNSNESAVPGDLMMMDCSINVEKGNSVSTNVTEIINSDCVDTINETIFAQTIPCNLNIKKEPDDLNCDTSTNKSPNAGNSSSIATNIKYEKNKQIKFRFVCTICDNSSVDRHSFALHMSSHSECNMHECIVCDTIFSTVFDWTNHMSHHQQQLDLNVLEQPQIIPDGIESHIPDIKVESMESPIPFTNLENETSANIKCEFKKPCKNITILKNVNKPEQVLSCNMLPDQFNRKISLRSHQPIHSTIQPYSCKYCNRKFSSKGPCTNHENSHTSNKNKRFLRKRNKLVPNETKSNIQLENININPISTQRRKIIRQKKILQRNRFTCHICNRIFQRRCYLTNHMLLLHKVYPQPLKQHNSSVVNNINNGESVKSERVKLFQEHTKNPSSVSVNTHLNNSLNNSIKNKSFCFICNKQFTNHGTLNNHMIIHSDNKPYSCQYCDRTFKMKASCLVHERSQKCMKENQNIISNHLIRKEQIESGNSSEFTNNAYDDKLNCKNITKNKRLWYVCDVCDKKFSTPSQLITHRNSHSIRPYVCKICDKSFDFKWLWNKHLKQHYSTNKKLKKSISNPKLDVGKLQTKSVQHKNKYKCTYCKKECISISCWKKHLSLSKECRRHCKQSLPEFTSVKARDNFTKCYICKKVYSTTYNLKKHLKNIHKQKLHSTELDTSANVDLQRKELTTKTILQKPKILEQKKNYHGNKKTYCSLCDKNYSCYTNLRRHQRIVHMVNKPLKCSICENVSTHIYAYRKHMKYRHKQVVISDNGNANNNTKQNVPLKKNYTVKYFCKLCKMSIATNTTLQIHIETHILNNCKCKDCCLEFETKAILGEHIMEKHITKITFSENKIHAKNGIQNSSPQVTTK